jgi:regulator of nonsense transcripts 2
MDVEFMVTDSLDALRPKVALLKNIEDAATAIDEMFASTVQGSGRAYPRSRSTHVILIFFPAGAGEGSGDDSGDEGERPTNDDDEDEDEDDTGTVNSLAGLSSHLNEMSFSSPLSSPTSAARLQNQRSSSRHPKKSSVPTRKKMQSLQRNSQNS